MLDSVTLADPDAVVTAVETGLNGVFDSARPRVVARAPGRLDVMGGIADTTGSRVVAGTLQAGAVVAAQRLDDPQFRCVIVDPRSQEIVEDVRAPLAEAAQGHAAKSAVNDLPGEPFSAARCVLASILTQEVGADDGGQVGWTVALWPSAPLGGGAGAFAAIQVGVARCVAALRSRESSPAAIVAACHQAQFRFFDLPVGPLDPMVALHGRPDGLIQFSAAPDAPVEPFAIPAGTRFLGIDSQKRSDRAADKYRDVFVCAAMGRRIIEAFARQTPHAADTPVKNLADVQPAEFVERYRDRLPTRLRGRDYVRQFGETIVDGCRIDESAVYKIRSRAEHHIYENQRVHEFIATLVRARNTGSLEAVHQAGELLYSSHWSYGQRCGLGSIETDLLVNRFRDCGPAGGIFGARVSGGGAGGMVTLFCSDNETAGESIDRVLDTYRKRTGLEPVIHEIGGDGALRIPVRRIA